MKISPTGGWLVVAGLFLATSARAQISFSALGGDTLDAVGVSNDGSVVVGSYRSSSGFSAPYRWTRSNGISYYANPGNVEYSQVTGVSGDGSTFIGTQQYFPNSPTGINAEAFRWTSVTSIVGLGTMPLGTFSSALGGISNDGSAIAIWGDGQPTAFRWTATAGMTGVESTTLEEARAMSADGSTIAGTTHFSPAGLEAFRWTESGGVMGLGALAPGESSVALGISADGETVVGTSFRDGPWAGQAFAWTEATGMVGLGFENGANSSVARAVSGDGKLIFGDEFAGAGNAFVWTPESGMRSLVDVLTNVYGLADELAGWTELDVNAVSADGRFVVGQGFNPDVLGGGWILDRGINPPSIPPPLLVPVPEPATYGLIGAVAIFSACLRRRLKALRAAANELLSLRTLPLCGKARQSI